MRGLAKNGMLLLMLWASVSCGSPSATVERCVISTRFQQCRCHDYLISSEKIGRVSESVSHDISYCDNLIGFKEENYVQLKVLILKLYKKINRLKK